jgi:hypothetical protein
MTMGRTFKPLSSLEAKENGLTSIKKFFNVKRKPGRPKKVVPEGGDCLKNRKPRGRPKKTVADGEQFPAVKTVANNKQLSLQVKKTRTNWSKGEDLRRLQEAVNAWNVKSERTLDSNAEPMTRNAFANLNGIPPETFRKYVQQQNPRVVGNSVGTKAIITKKDSQFVADVLRRADRGNDGKTRHQALDLIQEVKPNISFVQAENHFQHTFRGHHRDEIKQRPVKTQMTTTKRSAITVKQQYRWFQTYGLAVQFLREKNTGLCKETGKTCGELIAHFIIGGDETCLQASDAEAAVIGDRNKKKHEKKSADSRVSITMYRTGSIAGETGPTFFLLAGKHKRPGYDDSFLVNNGAAPGSSIIMTENAYMTDEAWDEIAPMAAKGIREMPVIRANPDWWVLEVFDGFGSHTSGLRAMKIRHSSKILSLKEEGDSSHVNQAYDKFVAKGDKATEMRTLSYLRSAKQLTRGVVDQWHMVHVGLAAVRNTTPRTWTRSFQACNMDPRCQLSFPRWCKKIESVLQAGQTFKTEGVNNDMYLLLPSFWHGMIPEEKKKAKDIFDSHNQHYSTTCILELHEKSHIPYRDMQSLRMCLALARDNLSYLDRGRPTEAEIKMASELPEMVVAAEKERASVADGLRNFQLKPPGLQGEDLLIHMTEFRRRNVKEEDHRIAPELMVSPRDKFQEQMMKQSTDDIVKGNIMREVGGNGAIEKLGKRKLDYLGYVKSESFFANDNNRLKRMEEQCRLTISLEETKGKEDVAAKEKKKLEKDSMAILVNPALKKLTEHGGSSEKLLKKEIQAILFIRYDVDLPMKRGKKEFVDRIKEAIERRPNGITVVPTT